MAKSTIGKWGDDFAIPILSEIAEGFDFVEGEELELTQTENGFVISRRLPRLIESGDCL